MSEFQASVNKLSYIKENFKIAALRHKDSDRFVLLYDEGNKRAVVNSGSNFHLTRAEKGHAVIEGDLDKAGEKELGEIYDLVRDEVEARGKGGGKKGEVEGNPFLPDLSDEKVKDEQTEPFNPFLPDIN